MEEPIEIVKRIPGPQIEPEENYSEQHAVNEKHTVVEYYDDTINEPEEKKPTKNFLLALFGVTIAGAIGYIGLANGDKSETNPAPTKVLTKIEQDELKIETAVIDNLQEKNNYYVESLALAKEAENKPTVVSPQKEEEEKKEKEVEQEQQTPIIPLKTEIPVATLVQSIPIKETEKKEDIKKEIVLEKAIIEKELVEKEALKREEAKRIEIAEIEAIEKKIKEQEILNEEVVKEEIVKKEIVTEEVVKTEHIVQKHKKATSRIKYEPIPPRIRTVRRGDTLASIAERFYGNPMAYRRLIRANPRIRSSRTALRLGEKIIIPRKDNKKTRRFIIVRRGNTLASISRIVYGNRDNINKIVKANYRIRTKYSTLRPGQKVYVPR